MEDRQTDSKYVKHRRGIATKLADIQRELETLNERVQAVLQIRDDQQEAPRDCSR